jgi:hypothetical protein
MNENEKLVEAFLKRYGWEPVSYGFGWACMGKAGTSTMEGALYEAALEAELDYLHEVEKVIDLRRKCEERVSWYSKRLAILTDAFAKQAQHQTAPPVIQIPGEVICESQPTREVKP